MNNEKDFIIENGVLIQYNGKDTSVQIPDGVTEIGDDAFRECENLTVYAPSGSYAEQYAKENNIKFERKK